MQLQPASHDTSLSNEATLANRIVGRSSRWSWNGHVSRKLAGKQQTKYTKFIY